MKDWFDSFSKDCRELLAVHGIDGYINRLDTYYDYAFPRIEIRIEGNIRSFNQLKEDIMSYKLYEYCIIHKPRNTKATHENGSEKPVLLIPDLGDKKPAIPFPVMIKKCTEEVKKQAMVDHADILRAYDMSEIEVLCRPFQI